MSEDEFDALDKLLDSKFEPISERLNSIDTNVIKLDKKMVRKIDKLSIEMKDEFANVGDILIEMNDRFDEVSP